MIVMLYSEKLKFAIYALNDSIPGFRVGFKNCYEIIIFYLIDKFVPVEIFLLTLVSVSCTVATRSEMMKAKV